MENEPTQLPHSEPESVAPIAQPEPPTPYVQTTQSNSPLAPEQPNPFGHSVESGPQVPVSPLFSTPTSSVPPSYPLPTQKKKRFLLPIIIIIVILIILVAGYFALKAYATVAASNYVKSTEKMLSGVDLTTLSSNLSASDLPAASTTLAKVTAELNTDKAKLPVLANVPFGANLSSKYKSAGDAQKQVKSYINSSATFAGSVNSFVKFAILLQKASTDIGAAYTATGATTTYQSDIKQISALPLTGKEKTVQTAVVTSLTSLGADLTKLESDMKTGNTSDLTAIEADVTTVSTNLDNQQSTLTAISADYTNTGSKLDKQYAAISSLLVKAK